MSLRLVNGPPTSPRPPCPPWCAPGRCSVVWSGDLFGWCGEHQPGPPADVSGWARLVVGQFVAVGLPGEDGEVLDPGVRVEVDADRWLSAAELDGLAAAISAAAADLRAIMGRPTIVGDASALAGHDAWMRLRGLSEETVQLRGSALRSLAASVAPRTLLEADAAALDRWQRELAGRLARSSRVAYLRQVKRYYAWCVAEGLVAVDPSAVLLPPKLPQARPRPIGEAELARAIAVAPPRERAWLVLAAYAGLRAGEIARLQVDDVDQVEAVILVRGKGGKEREVPAAPVVLDALAAYGLPPAGPVFRLAGGPYGRGKGGQPCRPDYVSNAANAYLRSVGVPASIHQLRHRFATQVYRQTRDLVLTADLLGHGSVSTTQRYARGGGRGEGRGRGGRAGPAERLSGPVRSAGAVTPHRRPLAPLPAQPGLAAACQAGGDSNSRRTSVVRRASSRRSSTARSWK